MSRSLPKPAPSGSMIPSIAPNDLPRLMKWLYLFDREFLCDNLWPRYDKFKRQAYQIQPSPQTHAGIQAPPHRRQLPPRVCDELPPRVLVLPKAPSCHLQDRLTALPPDIRLYILEFLLKPLPVPPPVQPEYEQENEEGDRHRHEVNTYVLPRLRPPHPLNQLASTSKTWRDQVGVFYRHQLLVLKQQIALGRQDSWVPWRELRTYTSCARMELVVRLSECCAFCGMETVSQSEK